MNAVRTLLAAGAVLLAAETARADFILNGTQHMAVTTAHNTGTLLDFGWADVLGPGYIANANVYDNARLRVTQPATSVYGKNVLTARVYENGHAAVLAGRIDYLYTYDTTTAGVSGGLVGYMNVRQNSDAFVLGGTVSTLLSQHSSSVDIRGGSIASLENQATTTADISGGSVGTLAARGFAVVTIHGMDFQPMGALSIVGDEVNGTGVLKGKWANGTPWSINITANDATATIQLDVVPEPITASLLGVGGLALLAGAIRRRRQA